MTSGGTRALFLASMFVAGCRCSDPSSPLVQDFEGRAGLGKWPERAPGEVTRSTEWKADGEASLRIDPGLLATIGSLLRTDFRGFDVLRVQVHNTGPRLAILGFELSDEHDSSTHDRHKSSFGVPPGDSTLDIDLAGGLWRGEENRPYRGPTKTPIDLGAITRIAFENRGEGAVFLDGLTLVRTPFPEAPGAFAFDFGPRGSRVMAHTIGVFEDSVHDPAAKFGFVSGKPSALRNSMSYPTPLLGDGLAWEDAVFQVDLDGGPYTGWIAFERGGFWEDEATGYSRASLMVNGKEAHTHDFTPHGPHFYLQDMDVWSVAEIPERVVWPAHAIERFSFTAAAGPNRLTLRVRQRTGPPLRVAGMFLAPMIPSGHAFVDAHEELQKKVVRATYPERDDSRRPAKTAPLDYPLIVEPRPLGEIAHPGDLPEAPIPDLPVVTAIAGHRAYVQLTLHAPAPVGVAISTAPRPASPVPDPRILRAIYGPKRPYSGGAAWIETRYFGPPRGDGTFEVGPGKSRSVLVEIDVPEKAPAGPVEMTLRFAVKGEVLAELPIALDVVDVDLPPLPIPVGLFMSGLPFGPEALESGEETWWRFQEELLVTLAEAGLNTVTGGAGLEYTMSEKDGELTFSGERALRYLALAKKHGVDRAVVGYSGFLPSIKYRRPDAARFQKAWSAFEAAHGLPPHYLYSYDEPSTPDELAAAIGYLVPFRDAGVRTIGFLSRADEERFTPLLDATFAPAVSGHTEAQLRRWAAEKRHIFLYNRGTGRLSMGPDLVRQIALGAAGRLEWIGLYTQGFAFDDLDGREPSYGMFVADQWHGALPTPRWLSMREGLLDARIRLALDKVLGPGEARPAWPEEYPADPAKWTDRALDEARAGALRRLAR